MKNYYRIMLGKKGFHLDECVAEGCIGVDYDVDEDLTGKLPDNWRDFNKRFIPVIIAANPGMSRVGAGLHCGALWTTAKGMQIGDVVLSPDASGCYRVGEVQSDYFFAPGRPLFHRRRVRWLDVAIARSAMSASLQGSAGSQGTVIDISRHAEEIERLVGGTASLTAATVHVVAAAAPDVEDPVAFAMEKHLEDFLVQNWKQTELSRDFSIFEEGGELVGQQYATDAGPIDILAVSKDKKRILVVELKRGRASDVVVGQILRYMGFVKDQIAEPGQQVEGAIIALTDDQKLRWAISAVPSITFYRYEISFKLVKG
jgi:restriction system protein